MRVAASLFLVCVSGCTLMVPRVAAGEAGNCDTVLDETTLRRLELVNDLLTQAPSAMPGSALPFTLGVVECCYFVRRVSACVEWSVEPRDLAGVEALPDGGGEFDPSVRVHMNPEAPHGTIVTLRADIESGRLILAVPIHVYTREGNVEEHFFNERSQHILTRELTRGLRQGEVQLSAAQRPVRQSPSSLPTASCAGLQLLPDVFEGHALPLAGPLDHLPECLRTLQEQVLQIVLADALYRRHRLAVTGDDDHLLGCDLERPGEVVLRFENRHRPHGWASFS
jgi:hypothetical protein